MQRPKRYREVSAENRDNEYKVDGRQSSFSAVSELDFFVCGKKNPIHFERMSWKRVMKTLQPTT